MRYINTYGVILKKTNFGDYDQYITFFSPDLGKAEAVAKGSRKIKSHFMGHLEPLNICRMQLYESARSLTLTQCQAENNHKHQNENYELSLITMLIVEILQKTLHSKEHGVEIFNLLINTLKTLNGVQKKFIHVESFKIKLLDIMGIIPDTSKCFICEKKWEHKAIIHKNDDNHFFCDSCAPHNLMQISYNTIKLLHYIIKSSSTNINKIKLSEKDKVELKNIINSFLHPYIGNELKTDKILSIYD
jgi:DNA repair protein RecO (recombination protein O)